MMKQVMQLREQLGWQGLAGLMLLLLILVFQVSILKQVQDETALMHRKVDVAHSKTIRVGPNIQSMGKQKDLENFIESLPGEEHITDVLAMIYSVAEASRVELKQAEYQLDDANATHMEYRMVFPVQGEYANIRFFVFRVLSDHPSIALDQMNFRRDKVNDSLLKAEIKFTLFLKSSR
jgi:Tfp pilus assembly protein PilO